MLSAIARNEDMKALNEMLMTKLYLTDATKRIAEFAFDLIGEGGLLAPTQEEGSMTMGWDSPGKWTGQYMMSLGIAIAGGTSNIQRNIIGEKLLGLPRDLRK